MAFAPSTLSSRPRGVTCAEIGIVAKIAAANSRPMTDQAFIVFPSYAVFLWATRTSRARRDAWVKTRVKYCCLTAMTARVKYVTIPTLSWTNSRAISVKRSARPPHRYSIATVRPSIQPSSCSRHGYVRLHYGGRPRRLSQLARPPSEQFCSDRGRTSGY